MTVEIERGSREPATTEDQLQRASAENAGLREELQGREDLEELEDNLLATASHDLRGPLTSIKGYAQLMLRALAAEEPDLSGLPHALKVIYDQAARMSRMLDLMIDAARIHAQLFPPLVTPCNVMESLAAVIATLPPEDSHRVEVKDLRDDAPAVFCDQDQIERVLANLIGNALKYSPADKPVRITVRRGADGTELSFSDEGIGIPAREISRLFERFYRTPHAQASGLPGTGLGLFICRGIVEAHGGRIWAQSAGEGQGSTFRFTLPDRPPQPDEAAP